MLIHKVRPHTVQPLCFIQYYLTLYSVIRIPGKCANTMILKFSSLTTQDYSVKFRAFLRVSLDKNKNLDFAAFCVFQDEKRRNSQLKSDMQRMRREFDAKFAENQQKSAEKCESLAGKTLCDDVIIQRTQSCDTKGD